MRIILLLSFCVLVNLAKAQNDVLDNSPASVKWYKLKTPHFNVLYQNNAKEAAEQVANSLEAIYQPGAKSLGKSPRRISILLQSQSSIANGFVSMFPRRSEFFAMPTQDYNFAGSNDWLNLLAIHEYRHIVQYENAITGFNKLFYYAFGTGTMAAMASAAAPQWFWEGDAVVTETAFSNNGRGKIPAFSLQFRTNLLTNRKFNYHKQYLRSYKDFIPNHYVLGYQFTSYLREKTNNPDIWGKIATTSWRVPFIPFRFSSSIKRHSGKYVVDLYKEMADSLALRWQMQVDTLQLTTHSILSNQSKTFTNYSYPIELENGKIIALKSGLGDYEQLVTIKDNSEEIQFVPGIVNDAGFLSATNSRIVWTEYEYDPRWRMKSYSIIKFYDVGSGRFWRLKKKTRLAGPTLSPDGYNVAYVETDVDYKHHIVVADVFNGNELVRLPNPSNHYYSMMRFDETGKRLVALKTSKQAKALVLIDIVDGTEKVILPETNWHFGHPYFAGDYVLVSGNKDGIDNLFAVEIQTGEIFQISNSKFGAYNPSVRKDLSGILYNEQTESGLAIAEMDFNPASWKKFDYRKDDSKYFGWLQKQEGSQNFLQSIAKQSYQPKRYRRISGTINPYNWGAYFNSDLSGATLGLVSRDILSTTSWSLGYNYNVAEQSGAWDARFSYQGFYPILDVGVSFADRKVNEGNYNIRVIERTNPDNITSDVTYNRNIELNWKETNADFGIRLPFVLTRSKFISALNISQSIGYRRVTDFSNNLELPGINLENFRKRRLIPLLVINDTLYSIPLYDRVGNNNLIYNKTRATLFLYHKQSPRDFLPKLGIYWNTEIYQTAFSSNLEGGQFSTYLHVYLPGLFKHHSLNGYVTYQGTNYLRNGERNYIFENRVPVPRGLSIFRAQNFVSMSANYALPVWYPDIALGPLLNIQRFRLNGFVDYAQGNSPLFNASNNYLSLGAEFTFDVNVMRFLPQLDLGFRISKGLTPSTTTFEFLLGTINF
ncbi:MAG: hypothetical protein O9340_02295 [Cyclobacteriaceae bacterium]|nr:hypothetical protein [Cyclobacteriaceae bacterium]